MRLQIRAAVTMAAAAAHPPQLPLRRTTMDSAAGSRRTTQQSAVASADSKRGSATGSVGALLAPPTPSMPTRDHCVGCVHGRVRHTRHSLRAEPAYGRFL